MNAIYEGGDTAPGKEVRQQEAYKRARAAANKEEIDLGGCTVKEYLEQLLLSLNWVTDYSQPHGSPQWIDPATLMDQEDQAEPEHHMRN